MMMSKKRKKYEELFRFLQCAYICFVFFPSLGRLYPRWLCVCRHFSPDFLITRLIRSGFIYVHLALYRYCIRRKAPCRSIAFLEIQTSTQYKPPPQPPPAACSHDEVHPSALMNPRQSIREEKAGSFGGPRAPVPCLARR